MTDLQSMKGTDRQRTRTVRQWVRILLLTALVVAVETGYLDLNGEPLPYQGTIPQTAAAQEQHASRAAVVEFNHTHDGTVGLADTAVGEHPVFNISGHANRNQSLPVTEGSR